VVDVVVELLVGAGAAIVVGVTSCGVLVGSSLR